MNMKAKHSKATANARLQKVRESLPMLEAQFLDAFRHGLRLARRIEQLRQNESRAAEDAGSYGKAASE